MLLNLNQAFDGERANFTLEDTSDMLRLAQM